MPEGIIFQSQTAYRDLRKMLVDTALVAVVSLPAGVFQPYSGVKTSILILDKALAKRADAIAFFKVENDGFGLGAHAARLTGTTCRRLLPNREYWPARSKSAPISKSQVADRAEGEDRREWRLQLERGAVSGRSG